MRLSKRKQSVHCATLSHLVLIYHKKSHCIRLLSVMNCIEIRLDFKIRVFVFCNTKSVRTIIEISQNCNVDIWPYHIPCWALGKWETHRWVIIITMYSFHSVDLQSAHISIDKSKKTCSTHTMFVFNQNTYDRKTICLKCLKMRIVSRTCYFSTLLSRALKLSACTHLYNLDAFSILQHYYLFCFRFVGCWRKENALW